LVGGKPPPQEDKETQTYHFDEKDGADKVVKRQLHHVAPFHIKRVSAEAGIRSRREEYADAVRPTDQP